MRKLSAFLSLLMLAVCAAALCVFAVGCGEPTDENGFVYELIAGTKDYRIIGVTDRSRTELTIPEKFGEARVVAVGGEAFKGCRNVTEVTIPDGIRVLGARAFEDTGIVPVEKTGYKTVSGWIVEADSEATALTLDGDVRGAAYNVFAGAKTTEVNYTGTVADWCKIKFSTGNANPLSVAHKLKIGGEEVRDLDLSGVTEIPFAAFYGLSSLTSVTFGDGLTAIGGGAFAECAGLTEIVLPASIREVSSSAFYNCTALSDVSLPEGLARLGNGAFMKCTGLQEITLPASLETVGSYVFNECDKLESITVNGKAKRGKGWAEQWANGSKANENKGAGIHWNVPAEEA